MKELKEYQAELHRRVEVECRTRRQQRARVLAVCIPLVLCVCAGALALPALLRRDAPEQAVAGTKAPQSEHSANERTEQDRPGNAGQADPENAAAPGGDSEITKQKQEQTPGQIAGASDAPQAREPGEAMEGLESVPADFSFRFVWNCYGISSYDSLTGRLVKTTDATHPEDYETELFLDEKQLHEVWALLSELELETYPAAYDPYNAPDAVQRVASEPNRDLILTLRSGGTEHTVACRGICLGGVAVGYDEKAKAFLRACDKLTALLEQTPAWQALPDYERFYE